MSQNETRTQSESRYIDTGTRIKCETKIVAFLFYDSKGKIAMSFVKTLGHALLGYMFITGGYGAFSEPGYRVDKVDQAGIPAARQAVILNGGTMMVAGTALAVGFLPKLAALILAVALVPTTFVGHSYWQEENPQMRRNQQIHFNKNLAMIGGLVVVLFEK